MLSPRHLLLLSGSLLFVAGCAARPDEAAPGSRTPGQISVAFRGRWWHFYERGLSWADGGLDAQAEADFRQCLALRLTDSRQGRTYGMHFVQVFAHRELGAVLLRRGAFDEAERELRLSLEQEPSAKAEYLLERLAVVRKGAVAAQPVAPAALPTSGRGIELASVVPAQTLMLVAGRLVGDVRSVLWAIDGAGAASRLPTDGDGGFRAELPVGASLTLGTDAGPDPEAPPPVAVAPPEQGAAVALELDGPEQGRVVADGRAWYRWRVAAPAGLGRLRVHDDHGTLLADLPLNGLRAAGTLRLDLASGEQTLRFTLFDGAGAAVTAERRVDARPAPPHDRRLRAVALAIPLQAPRPGSMLPGDDPRLRSALLEDGRFRFVEAQADALLARELSLVEAGYVDRSTAAAAGRRLSARYVIAGTVTRGGRDAECYLRLIHADSGAVVASADAYAEIASSAEADRLFAAVAGRLRQAFPVLATGVTSLDGERVRLDCGSRSGAAALMRVHVFPAPPDAGVQPSGIVEIESVEDGRAQARRSTGTVPRSGHGVSE
jgi:hypothetical protein